MSASLTSNTISITSCSSCWEQNKDLVILHLRDVELKSADMVTRTSCKMQCNYCTHQISQNIGKETLLWSVPACPAVWPAEPSPRCRTTWNFFFQSCSRWPRRAFNESLCQSFCFHKHEYNWHVTRRRKEKFECWQKLGNTSTASQPPLQSPSHHCCRWRESPKSERKERKACMMSTLLRKGDLIVCTTYIWY